MLRLITLIYRVYGSCACRLVGDDYAAVWMCPVVFCYACLSMAIVGSSLNVPGYGWLLQFFASSELLEPSGCRVREPTHASLCVVSIGFVALLSVTATHIYTQTHGKVLDTISVIQRDCQTMAPPYMILKRHVQYNYSAAAKWPVLKPCNTYCLALKPIDI